MLFFTRLEFQQNVKRSVVSTVAKLFDQVGISHHLLFE